MHARAHTPAEAHGRRVINEEEAVVGDEERAVDVRAAACVRVFEAVGGGRGGISQTQTFNRTHRCAHQSPSTATATLRTPFAFGAT